MTRLLEAGLGIRKPSAPQEDESWIAPFAERYGGVVPARFRLGSDPEFEQNRGPGVDLEPATRMSQNHQDMKKCGNKLREKIFSLREPVKYIFDRYFQYLAAKKRRRTNQLRTRQLSIARATVFRLAVSASFHRR